MSAELKPVIKLTDNELLMEYVNFVFTGTTEQLVSNLDKSRFEQVTIEHERRKDKKMSEYEPTPEEIADAVAQKVEKKDGTDLIRVYFRSVSTEKKWYSLYKRLED